MQAESPGQAREVFTAEVEAAEPYGAEDGDLAAVEQRILAGGPVGTHLNYLGKECAARGYLRRAAYAFSRLLEVEPERTTALEHLARCYVKLGQRGEAVDTLVRILETDAVPERLRQWARTNLRDLGPASGAEAPAAASPTRPTATPDDPGARTALIKALEKRKIVTQYLPADRAQLEQLEERLAEEPDNAGLLEWYAFLLYSSGRIPESISTYERLLRAQAATDHMLYYLGSAYLKAFDTKSAAACWDALVDHFPDSPLIGKIDSKQNRLRELSDALSPAASRDTIARRLRQIQVQLDEQGPLREAAPAPAAPAGPGASGRRPDDLITTADASIADDAAMAQVEDLLVRVPDNASFVDWAAFLHYCRGDLARSQELYLRVVQGQEATPESFYYLGAIYYRTGRDLDAVDMWNVLIDRFGAHELAAKARSKLQRLYQGIMD